VSLTKDFDDFLYLELTWNHVPGPNVRKPIAAKRRQKNHNSDKKANQNYDISHKNIIIKEEKKWLHKTTLKYDNPNDKKTQLW